MSDRNTLIAENMYESAMSELRNCVLEPKDKKDIIEVLRYLLQNDVRKIKY
jgi:hypothetical protein